MDQRHDVPLYTPDELQTVTGGTWIREPGPQWDPDRVRAPVADLGLRLFAAWLPSSILFVRSDAQLRKWFGSGKNAGEEATGCVVVEHNFAQSRHLPTKRAIYSVKDRKHAVRALADYARGRMQGRVAAITGTVGKTTTRTMLARILEHSGSVLTNFRNGNLLDYLFNYMASARADLDFAVFECGLGGEKGDFSIISEVIRPDLVVLTQLDIAHLDRVTDVPLSGDEALRLLISQKLQLLDGMRPGGTVILNSGMPLFEETAAALKGRYRVATFGETPISGARLLEATADGPGTVVTAFAGGKEVRYRIAVPGRFMALNSIAALAAAVELGIDPGEASARLDGFEAVPGRARLVSLQLGGRSVTLIDDSFNATPLSMRSTLELLGSLSPGPNGRRIAVLGDIAHLGEESAAAHAGLASAVAANEVAVVFTFGPEMFHLHNALPNDISGVHFQDKQQLSNALLAELRSGDVVTVKASFPSRFDRIVEVLRRAARKQGATG